MNMVQNYAVLFRRGFRIGFVASVIWCAFSCSGCGSSAESKQKKQQEESYFRAVGGHFQGVVYNSRFPAPGEKPAFTVDFQVGQGAVLEGATYQSTTDDTGGYIDGAFGYTNNASKPLYNFQFLETYHQGVPTTDYTKGTTYHSFKPVFGPPTNNGKHFEGFLLFAGAYDGIPDDVPRYKAVFDLVP